MYTTEGKKIVSTNKAPKAIGPYSQAIVTEDMVFTAGQVGFDPTTMEIVAGGIEAESRQVLTNLKFLAWRGLHKRDFDCIFPNKETQEIQTFTMG